MKNILSSERITSVPQRAFFKCSTIKGYLTVNKVTTNEKSEPDYHVEETGHMGDSTVHLSFRANYKGHLDSGYDPNDGDLEIKVIGRDSENVLRTLVDVARK